MSWIWDVVELLKLGEHSLEWDVETLVWDFQTAIAHKDEKQFAIVGFRMFQYLSRFSGSRPENCEMDAYLELANAAAERSLSTLRQSAEALKHGIHKFIPRREWSVYVPEKIDGDSEGHLKIFRPISLHSDPPLHIGPASFPNISSLVASLQHLSSNMLSLGTAEWIQGATLVNTTCDFLVKSQIKPSSWERDQGTQDILANDLSALTNVLSSNAALMARLCDETELLPSTTKRDMKKMVLAMREGQAIDFATRTCNLIPPLIESANAFEQAKRSWEEERLRLRSSIDLISSDLEAKSAALHSIIKPLREHDGFPHLSAAAAQLGDDGSELRNAIESDDMVTIVALCIESLSAEQARRRDSEQYESIVRDLRKQTHELSLSKNALELEVLSLKTKESEQREITEELKMKNDELQARLIDAWHATQDSLSKLNQQHQQAMATAEAQCIAAVRNVHPELERERALTRELAETIKVLERECRFCRRSREN